MYVQGDLVLRPMPFLAAQRKQVMKSWAGAWERGMYKATVYTYDASMHYYLSVDVLDISSHGCQ